MSDYLYEQILNRKRRKSKSESPEAEESDDLLTIVDFSETNEETGYDDSFIPFKDQEEIKLTGQEQPKLDESMKSSEITKMINRGEYTLAERMLMSLKYREYRKQFWDSLGLKGKPLHLHADDLLRFEMYNRKIRANRLAGKESGLPMTAIPTDIFVYIWKNSVILKRNEVHVFMLSKREVAYGMGLDLSSISDGFKALEKIGLITRLGRAKRSHLSYSILYQITDLDKFFEDNGLKVPKNYKIKDRVADIIIGAIPKKKKERQNIDKNRDEKVKNSPYWGLWTDIDLLREQEKD